MIALSNLFDLFKRSEPKSFGISDHVQFVSEPNETKKRFRNTTKTKLVTKKKTIK